MYLPLGLLKLWLELVAPPSSTLFLQALVFATQRVQFVLYSAALVLSLVELQLQGALGALRMLGYLAQLSGVELLQLGHLLLPKPLLPFEHLHTPPHPHTHTQGMDKIARNPSMFTLFILY